jgi:hypothetical protein
MINTQVKYILAAPCRSKHQQAVLLNDSQEVISPHSLQRLQPSEDNKRRE